MATIIYIHKSQNTKKAPKQGPFLCMAGEQGLRRAFCPLPFWAGVAYAPPFRIVPDDAVEPELGSHP